MSFNLDIGRYDPCPCGSGKKYKFCCAAKAKEQSHGKFPIGTVAYYGPDDKTVTKIAAGVVRHEHDTDPLIERLVGAGIASDVEAAERIKRFFAEHGVKKVVVTDGVLGCPHEEGKDFPVGRDCPFCPFWAGKQGTARRADNAFLPRIVPPDDDLLNDEEEDERDCKEALKRSNAIVGEETDNRDQAVDRMFAHLRDNLSLPCAVTGTEDFRWEEPYVLGGWSLRDYKKLKKTQPSYTDRFELLRISRGEVSQWMMFGDEDIAAHVRRISDGRNFVLGLAELEATEKTSPNHQLIDDYVVWFVTAADPPSELPLLRSPARTTRCTSADVHGGRARGYSPRHVSCCKTSVVEHRASARFRSLRGVCSGAARGGPGLHRGAASDEGWEVAGRRAGAFALLSR